MINAMLISFGLSNNNFQGEDLYSACYIFNRVLYKKNFGWNAI